MMIQSEALTDTGRKRQTNQDCFLINEPCSLYLLADGMGGAVGGAEAARLTVQTINEFIGLAQAAAEVTWPFGYDLQVPFETNVLRTATLLANFKVCRAAEEMELNVGMGSTVVVVWVRGNAAWWTHVGDSRLYLMRGGELCQLSEDHTLVQEQLKRGLINAEEARTHTLRHVVTRSVGNRDRFQVDVHELSLQDGDLLLLCCDGLSNPLTLSQIQSVLRKQLALSLAVKELVEAANEAGGDDNITAVLIAFGPKS